MDGLDVAYPRKHTLHSQRLSDMENQLLSYGWASWLSFKREPVESSRLCSWESPIYWEEPREHTSNWYRKKPEDRDQLPFGNLEDFKELC